MVPEAGPLSVPWWLKSAHNLGGLVVTFFGGVLGGEFLCSYRDHHRRIFEMTFEKQLRGTFRQKHYAREMWGVARAPGRQMARNEVCCI